MTNGNGAPVDDGRKCWGSARERERRRARFHIRERVVQDRGPHVSSSSLSLSRNVPTNPQQIQQYLAYIKGGDRSKFSLSELDRNFDVISARIPISYLDNQQSVSSPPEDVTASLRDHSLQLCTAWFGTDYAKALEEYFHILESFTFMEYAVWMGKFSIVGSLLVAGVNPCISAHVLQGQEGPHRAHQEEDEEEDTCALSQWGTRVMKRFFHCFPLPLSTYIVKRFVELQWTAARHGRHVDGTLAASCALCGARKNQKLLFFERCQHYVCHGCFWQDIVDHIDGRGDYSDVVVCPFCDAKECSNSHDRVSLDCGDTLWTALSPSERCRRSLLLFQNLPLDRAMLKKVTGKKKKKLPEAEHWSSNWNGAVSPSLGLSQAVRHDKFWYFLERKSIHCIRGCLFAGVNINWRSEYGQTALYVSAWRGDHVAVRLLLGFGADTTLCAHDGSTPLQIAMACGHTDVCQLLGGTDQEKTVSDSSQVRFPSAISFDSPEVSTLIPLEMEHPGAGSYTIDDVFSSDQVDWLLDLHSRIPVETTQKKKAGLCSDRSYFCDSEGGLRRAIEQAIVRSSLGSRLLGEVVHVFAHMRFLHYSSVGTTLNPHIDICRTDPLSGLRSSHTLIVYLTDCHQGGATSLLGSVSGEGRHDIVARVTPKRGRLFLFPHACPHEGNEVMDVPKIILRGEVFLGEKHNYLGKNAE